LALSKFFDEKPQRKKRNVGMSSCLIFRGPYYKASKANLVNGFLICLWQAYNFTRNGNRQWHRYVVPVQAWDCTFQPYYFYSSVLDMHFFIDKKPLFHFGA